MFVGLSAFYRDAVGRSDISDVSLSPFILALFIVFEWHLAWSAVSGMEIPMFIFVSLALLELSYRNANLWQLGVVWWVLVLVRPEGIVLAGLVGIGTIVSWAGDGEGRVAKSLVARLLDIAQFALGAGVVVAPYLLVISPLRVRLFRTRSMQRTRNTLSCSIRGISPLAGPTFRCSLGWSAVFVAARIYPRCYTLAIQRAWRALVPVAWALSLPALYAVRLPVTYQHGRYEMPIVPILVLYGFCGTALIFQHLRGQVLRVSWMLSTAVLLGAFWLMGWGICRRC